ncbi:MAG TPA: hypothetical protein VG796_28280 [Verrucomicrobiales bacterium]|nr:hypothetical protein [Verrucomicrobiales bacterium]
MSSTEILEQIPALPDDEIRLIEAALRARRVEKARKSVGEDSIRPGFEQIAEKVFSTHGKLLHKLSQ